MKYAVRHFHMEISKSLHQHIYLDYVVISQDGTLFFFETTIHFVIMEA